MPSHADGAALVARAATALRDVLAPSGVALVVSARPLELLAAMRCADEAALARGDSARCGSGSAHVVPLNAGGAGVLVLHARDG